MKNVFPQGACQNLNSCSSYSQLKIEITDSYAINLNCRREFNYRKTCIVFIIEELLVVTLAQSNLFCFNYRVEPVLVILCSRDCRQGTPAEPVKLFKPKSQARERTEHADSYLYNQWPCAAGDAICSSFIW